MLDSFSTDRTTELANRPGVRIVQRKFDNFASQRNHGLQQISYRHPWVLMLDADEVVPEALRRELLQLVAKSSDSLALVSMRRKDHLFGRWLQKKQRLSDVVRPAGADRPRVGRAIR